MNLNQETYSDRSLSMLQTMYSFAARMKHGFIGSEHILWAIAQEKGTASHVLSRYGFDTGMIESYLQEYDRDAAEAVGGIQILQFTAEAQRVFSLAEAQAQEMNSAKTEPEHLLLAILLDKDCAACRLIQSVGQNPDGMREELLEEVSAPAFPVPVREKKAGKKRKEKSVLYKYGHDLTADARAEKLDPVIGRDTEIDQIIRILSRRKKNNPVLVGEAGVGKTAIAEGLAQRIIRNRVPDALKGKRLISVDLTGMLSGTRFRGDFEERIQSFLREAVQEKDVILFIDELHTLIGAGSGEGALDAANILKPELARGDLQIIGATTPQEYSKYIEKDSALERRFQPVTVAEPDENAAIDILMGLKPEYEAFHGVQISDEAIRSAVTLSARYVQDRFLPDKAVDLIDEAAARIKTRVTSVPLELETMEHDIQNLVAAKKKAADSQDYEEAALLKKREEQLSLEFEEQRSLWRESQNNCVGKDEIAEVVSSWTHIPVTALTLDERNRLRGLEDTLHERLIGQDAAVTSVSRAIRRSRTGVTDPGRPIGSFLFLGPTGVGKTELCRTLAEAMFQDEDAVIRFDMSEYTEPYTVSRLVGSPPGYVGHEEGGQLTEQVRRKPYSIVLLDEIEKAHRDVWNTLLQIMDDGRLTDSRGRTVSFKNTILIMTSNLGAREITGKGTLGFSTGGSSDSSDTLQIEDMKDRVMEAVKQAFPPEFINRLDEVIVFHPLKQQHIRKIAENMTAKLVERMRKQGVRLIIEDSAIDLLAEKGYDAAYGARPLRRTIQTMLEDPLADCLLEKDPAADCVITAAAEEQEIRLRIDCSAQV